MLPAFVGLGARELVGYLTEVRGSAIAAAVSVEGERIEVVALTTLYERFVLERWKERDETRVFRGCVETTFSKMFEADMERLARVRRPGSVAVILVTDQRLLDDMRDAGRLEAPVIIQCAINSIRRDGFDAWARRGALRETLEAFRKLGCTDVSAPGGFFARFGVVRHSEAFDGVAVTEDRVRRDERRSMYPVPPLYPVLLMASRLARGGATVRVASVKLVRPRTAQLSVTEFTVPPGGWLASPGPCCLTTLAELGKDGRVVSARGRKVPVDPERNPVGRILDYSVIGTHEFLSPTIEGVYQSPVRQGFAVAVAQRFAPVRIEGERYDEIAALACQAQRDPSVAPRALREM